VGFSRGNPDKIRALFAQQPKFHHDESKTKNKMTLY